MDQLPRSVTVEALALSPAELREFPRWYTDLLLRKRSDTVTIGDVTAFVDNFGIQTAQKRAIERLFGDQLVTIDPPQFYIYLRLAGHVLQGKQVRKELAFVSAPVPKPRSILSKRGAAAANAEPASEMDSFLSLMTGNSSSASHSAPSANGVRKRKKRVTFDSRPPQITEAAHRSMGELLRQTQIQEQYNLPQQPQLLQQHQQQQQQMLLQQQQRLQQEPEPDQPIANNQFAHVNIDSVLHNGQSMLPEPPAPRKTGAGDSFIQQLTQSASSSASNDTASSKTQPSNSISSHFSHPQPQIPQLSTPAPPPSRAQSQQLGSQTQQLQQQTQQQQQQFLSPHSTGTWQPSSQKLGPQSTGSLPVSMQPQIQSQLTGQMPMQSQMQIQPQITGHSQMQPQLSGQMNHQMNPQMNQMNHQIHQGQLLQIPQIAGISPQLTGLSPQISGQPHISPQASGIQHQVSGLRNPTMSHMNVHLPQQTQPMLQPPQMQQMQQQQQMQQPPQMHSTQGYAQTSSDLAQPGMQFINSVQNPPQNISQSYQYGQAYNMQSLRNGMPNW